MGKFFKIVMVPVLVDQSNGKPVQNGMIGETKEAFTHFVVRRMKEAAEAKGTPVNVEVDGDEIIVTMGTGPRPARPAGPLDLPAVTPPRNSGGAN
jgi:hypothetical protein